MRPRDLSPEQWKTAFELLDAALELPDADRQRWLDRLDAAHAPLKPALQELLARQLLAGREDFVSKLPEFTRANALEQAGDAPGPEPGECVGPYRLVRELGRGGMGRVWLAERVDGSPKRAVALKLPHLIWSDALMRRLARERDILASLEHPSIARLYEAGSDASGRPFLAMQFIEGKAFDQYVRERNPGVREAVALLLQVARALAHAHARLVVHRDVKPSNILVDAAGAIHLLDFGVAKLLEPDSPAEAAMTQLMGRAFTPDYAAPEQIGEGEITTATDVYALAVVAYEMLTGSRPYRLQSRGVTQLARELEAIRVPPASEHTAQPSRRRELRGDLDAVLGKAMHPEPTARYPTAAAFADDLQRFLDREPVAARPDSAAYRLRKFTARNRVPLAVSAILALIVGGAALVSMRQAQLASEQRNRAVVLLDRSEALTDFLGLMFAEVAAPGRSATVGDVLERSEALVSTAASRDPEHQAVILQALASYYESFGNPAKAQVLLERASGLLVSSSDHGLKAELRCQRAFALSQNSDAAAATRDIEAVLADPRTPPMGAVLCLRRRVDIAQAANDAEGMVRFAWRAWAELGRSGSRDPVTEAELLGDLGLAHMRVGKVQEAERYYAQSLRKLGELGRLQHPATNTVRIKRGVTYMAVGDILAARAQFDEALEFARQHAVDGEPPPSLQYQRALVSFEMGDLDAARTGYEAAIAAARRNGNAVMVAFATIDLGRIAISRGDVERAEGHLAEVNAELGRTIAREGPNGTGAQLLTARIQVARGRYAEAVATYDALLAFWQSRGMAETAQMAAALRGRADANLCLGRFAATFEDASRALRISRQLQGARRHSRHTGLAELLVSQSLARTGDLAGAKAAAESAHRHLAGALGAQSTAAAFARELVDARPESPLHRASCREKPVWGAI